MKILSIIPARGGSKGIPKKNIQPIAGQPLITWNIQAAKKSKYINRLIVSTDDDDIASIAQQYGSEIILRPDAISNDEASSESALLHVLDELKMKENYVPDLLVFLQCTSPLTSTEDIDNCIDTLIKNNADSATTVTDFHYFVWQENNNGTSEGINHDKNFRPRRQDRQAQHLETGAVYVMQTKGFIENQHRFFGKTVLSHMPQTRVMEIDEPIDLLIAEIRLRELLNHSRAKQLPKNIKAVVFDFDGVMTDNKVYISENGQESVRCDRSDGMGINYLKKTGLQMAVMSTETNPVVTARCKKLGIECYQNLGYTKVDTLIKWCNEKQIKMSELVYMGNDINDAECLKLAACGVVPSDAHSSIISLANITLNNKGGEGAVRELCDLITNNI